MARRRFKDKLALCQYFYDLFGQEKFNDFRNILRGQEEGFGSDGHSNFYRALRGVSGLKISEERLQEYDLNIKEYVDRMNRHREEPIRLKYFQYLAVLFSEIYLDKYFNERNELLKELKEFTSEKSNESPNVDLLEFQEEDLRKIAYWMATGSGKTFIMHINFWQFLRYNEKDLDNIILITPNEGLTKQHIEEMEENGINAIPFEESNSRGYSKSEEIVEVIDLYKLDEESGEKTVSVEAFEGNNLVFVDEGHRGMSGDIWLDHRKSVVGNGFVFEYSATFGQALDKTDDIELKNEYFKSILLDYSYRHFYEDGYGKDYRILNLKSGVSQKLTNRLLLANLLSLYEQKLCYEQNKSAMEEYNLKPPLWAFFGGKVNAVYKRGGEETSDVLTVVKFLHEFLQNSNNEYHDEIERILRGDSELKDEEGRDIFEDRFDFLKKKGLSPEEIYNDISQRLFHSSGSDLELVNLKDSEGEIGLKSRSSDTYFGVINIGDENRFLRLVEEKADEITQREDEFRGSLFDEIKEKSSEINLLVGSKKFLQGWSSWRVSNIGLMNLGRSRGPEIIQLFGRGIRLLGKNKSLKRSTELEGERPDYLSVLETLNIFGIRADYMTEFREYLEKEGVETRYKKHEIPIRIEEKFLEKDLKVPRVEEDRDFQKEVNLELEPDEDLKPKVDLRPRIQVEESVETKTGEERRDSEKEINPELLTLINWNRVYFDILKYKNQKEYKNLRIEKDVLKEIMEKGLYRLYCSEECVSPTQFRDIEQVERTVKTVLRSYIKSFYSEREEEWESTHMEYKTLDKNDGNLSFGSYNLKVPKSKEKLLGDIQDLLEKKEKLYKEELGDLNVYFDRHIYQPLLLKYNEDIKIEPYGASLNEGERKFVEDLRTFLEENKQDGSLEKTEVYLLRNQQKRGIGFYKAGNFHPDFILWIKQKEKQHIFFLDPHGLIHSMHLDDPKVLLSKKIKNLEDSLGNENISLESFIISVTEFDDISTESSKGEYEERNVFFQEDEDYINKILEKVGS